MVSSLFSRLMGIFGATKDAKPSSDFAFTSHPYPTNTDTEKSKSNKSLQRSIADLDVMMTTKGLSPLVQELRLVKSEAEVKIMRQAGEISGKAFIEVNPAT